MGSALTTSVHAQPTYTASNDGDIVVDDVDASASSSSRSVMNRRVHVARMPRTDSDRRSAAIVHHADAWLDASVSGSPIRSRHDSNVDIRSARTRSH